jgi:hypothetical protein
MSFDQVYRLRQLALNSQLEASLHRLYGDQRSTNPVAAQPETAVESKDTVLFTDTSPYAGYEEFHEMVLQLVCEPKVPMQEISNIRTAPYRELCYINPRYNQKALLTLHTILTPSQVPPRYREIRNNWNTVLGEHDQILALYTGNKKPRHLEVLIHDTFHPQTSCSFTPQIFNAYIELIHGTGPSKTGKKPKTRVTHLSLIGSQRAIKRFLESEYGQSIKTRYGSYRYLLQLKSRESTVQPSKGWLRELKGKPDELVQLLKSLHGALKLTPNWVENDFRYDRAALAERLNYARTTISEGNRADICRTILSRLSKIRPHWPHPYSFEFYNRLSEMIQASGLDKTSEKAQKALEAALRLHNLRFFDPENPDHAQLRRVVENISLVIGQDPIMVFNAEFNGLKIKWLEEYTKAYDAFLGTLSEHIQNHYYSLAGFSTPPPGETGNRPKPLKKEFSHLQGQDERTVLPDLVQVWKDQYGIAASYANNRLEEEGIIQFPQLELSHSYGEHTPHPVPRSADEARLPFSPAFAPPLPPDDIWSPDQPLRIQLSEALKPRFAHPWAEAQLEIDNDQAQRFNPAVDKPTGIKDATLSRPVFEKTGLEPIASDLANLGYLLRYSQQNEIRLLRKARQQRRALAPLYPLTEYERNAYYQYGEAQAQTTVTNTETNEIIWQQGKHYQITPSWERTTVTIDTDTDAQPLPDNAREIIPAGQNLSTISYNRTTTRSVEYGYATFLVTTESGQPIKIKETFTRQEEAGAKEAISDRLATLQQELEELTVNLSTATNSRSDPQPAQLINHTRARIASLNSQIADSSRELAEHKITIETFNEVFPPPTPALATETYEQEIRQNLARIRDRFSPYYDLKNYELRVAALSSIKNATANGSCMGAGKTLMSIMSAWSKGSHYAVVVAPTKAMKTWAEELDKCGLYHELIGYRFSPEKGWYKNPKENGISHIRRLNQRMMRRQRQTNRLGLIETEFYVVSSELLALGDQSNQRFDLWHADYPLTPQIASQINACEITLPPNRWQILSLEEHDPDNQLNGAEKRKLNSSREVIRVWSDRIDNQLEIKQAGWEGVIPVKRFSNVTSRCPVCRAESPTWLESGSCLGCGHHHRSHRRGQKTVRTTKMMTMRELRARGIFTTAPLPSNFCFTSTKNSSLQYPAYKMLGRKFGTKIIDEVHTQAGFDTLHGQAIQNIRTKHTMILSGTLCRTYITEIEPLLCLLHPLASGQFPHAPWDMTHFREQFSTQEKENVRHSYQRNGRDLNIASNTTRGRNFRKTVPEASNLTRLRAYIHGVHTYAEEHEIQNAWNLAKPRERLIPVTLEAKTQEQENQWTSELRALYEAQLAPARDATARNSDDLLASLNPVNNQDSTNVANGFVHIHSAQHRRPSTLHYTRAVQRQIENYFSRMRLIADGPEKLDAIIAWTREQNAAGHRCVLVGGRRQFFKMIVNRMQNEGIRFTTLDEQTAPEDRHELLTNFRNSTIPNLLSRTRLINTNYNQLTCCSRGLFWGLDPSPSAMEQMKYRLSRPGQTNPDIEWGILITVNPSASSYEHAFYNILLRKQQAIRETLKSVDRPRTLDEVVRQNEERQLQSQLLEEILHQTAPPLVPINT